MSAGEVARGLLPTSSTSRRRALRTGWELCRVSPNACEEPGELEGLKPQWARAQVPGTAAQALGDGSVEAGAAGFAELDGSDIWYRCSFAYEVPSSDPHVALEFEGLATLADVWLNGHPVLSSSNMFVAHRVGVAEHLAPTNQLYVRFRSLKAALGQRLPRPRWKTRLVRDQSLRFYRTTLLGRIPGWTPACVPIGPWRSVSVLEDRDVVVEALSLQPTLQGDGHGLLAVRLTGRMLSGAALRGARIRVGDTVGELTVDDRGQASYVVHGSLSIRNIRPWWPHTHGVPQRYAALLELELSSGVTELDCGQIGFRSVSVARGGDDESFQFVVNGEPIFCRGACWTTVDMASLSGTVDEYAAALRLARAAGANMLRVGGTMTYEHDAFYDLCDELGILVWQDFMFANMDYPSEDEAFVALVELEARQQLLRLSPHPCLAILCGGSEVAQQAAMLGLPRETWLNDIFSERLPALCAELANEVPYIPSTPWGGALPFRLDRGVSHYFGVGAYMRPLDDARLRPPRFAAECLAFSIPPEDATLDHLLSEGQSAGHDPRYKERVPRDSSAGWDFADVTDHYLERLFSVDVRNLRYEQPARYVELSRVTVGEVVAATMTSWRARACPCSGALLWFYRDLWAGAGWGILDSDGIPKAPYYFLKRAWSPVALWLSDEGLNGLQVVVDNETPSSVTGALQVTIYRERQVVVEQFERVVELEARAQVTLDLEAELGRFIDPVYAYRFGEANCDVICATLRVGEGADTTPLAHAVHFPQGLALPVESNLGLTATARARDDGSFRLELHTERFAQAVAIVVRGYLPDDNYIHLAPGATRPVVLRPHGQASRFAGRVKALNCHHAVRIVVES